MSVDLTPPEETAGEASRPADAGFVTPSRGQARALATRVATAVRDAFVAFNRRNQLARHTLYGLSMSGLGACRRRGAYQLAGTEPSDPALAVTGENRQANLGTMIHAGLLPALAGVLGGRDEVAIELNLEVDEHTIHIPGRSDLYWPDARCVLDLKTTGEHKLSGIAAHDDVQFEHLIQVAGYALGAEQQGLPVEYIGWIYLDRGDGTCYVIIEPFTDELRTLVIDRARELLVYATSPDDAPRDGPGPGNRAANMICNGCAWLRACWGPTAVAGVTGAQATQIEDFGGVERVLVGYLNAREAESAASKRKEFYRDFLHGAAPGAYGSARWSMGKAGEVVDTQACVELLRDADIPVPMKSGTPRLTVAWVIPDQTQETGQSTS